MKFEYHEELMKEKILFTSFLCAGTILVLNFIEGKIYNRVALIIGLLGLIIVSFFIFTEKRLGKIEFAISHKALIIIYRDLDFWIYYHDMEYIKQTEFGILIGLKDVVEEFAILDKMENYDIFLNIIFSKARDNNVRIEILEDN